MPILAIGILALILGVYALRQLGRASPAQVAYGIRGGGGMLALAVAAFLLLRGRFMLALGAGGLSAYLFTGEKFTWQKLAEYLAERQRAQRQSQARTAILGDDARPCHRRRGWRSAGRPFSGPQAQRTFPG